MRLLTTSEEHFYSTDDGQVHTGGIASYSFWSRYKTVFSALEVVARVKSAVTSSECVRRAGGPGVSFCALPDFTGVPQYLQARHQARISVREAVQRCDAFLLRVPGLVSHLVCRELLRANRPYAVEVLGDPWESLRPRTWADIPRATLRVFAMQQMKRICAGASALHYVTVATLQKRYPPPVGAYADGFSDANLAEALAPPEILGERLRRICGLPWADKDGQERLRIGFVGSFARLYKGPDVLLRAAQICVRRGLRLSLQVVGDGRHKDDMNLLAARLGLAGNVEFKGQLPSGKEVFDAMDCFDLFVLPSRTEGMPRALLEAMARGCPCIASDVGGIPELLEPDEIFPVNDERRLAALILEVTADAGRMAAMSQRNANKSGRFAPEILRPRRLAFLEAVKQRSER